MCGIAGVIAWQEKFRTSPDVLLRMQAAIAHRGPDGKAVYINDDQSPLPHRPQCAMAFCRLAVLDPDPRAMQPFQIYSEVDKIRLSMVFNGEIYNFRELKRELSSLRPDYFWRTTSDTEVLLVAYDCWRENCVDKLDGMFAFAIWDHVSQSLFMARDRMGQKPLYIAIADGSPGTAVAFASELSALTELPWLDRSIDRSALADYLSWGYIGGEHSIYAGTAKLPPATWRKFTASDSTSGRYFDANQSGATSKDPVQTTRALLIDAVGRQLVSDVPLGCFLSGGIDSSIIAAAMKQASPDAVHTFSIAFEDARYDESAYAAEVAAHLGTHHHTFQVHADAAADLPRLAQVYGEPFADSSALPTHYLSRETRQFVKVALSGDGGDELFGGYDRYRAMQLGQSIGMMPGPLRNIFARLADLFPAGHPKSPTSRLLRFLRTINEPPARRYASYLRIFSEKMLSDLWPDGQAIPPATDLVDQFAKLACSRDIVEAALALDRISYLPDDLLVKLDRASMLHALEVRSPFLDSQIIRFAAGLTAKQLLSGGQKSLLRRAFAADLPATVFNRPKMGFAVPIGDWFRSSLRDLLHDHLLAANSFAAQHFNRAVIDRLLQEHQSARVDHTHRLYALLTLELWWKGPASS